MSPSDLEWWQWLLVALGATIAGGVTFGISSRAEKGKHDGLGCIFGGLAWLCGLAGFIAFIIAAIRFVKWVWNG